MPNGVGGIVGGAIGGIAGTIAGGGTQTVFRVYAEGRISGGAWRRFLIQLDPSSVTGTGSPLLNYLDLDNADPKPDVSLRASPIVTGTGAAVQTTGITLEMRPVPAGRALVNVELFVYLCLSGDIFPVNTATPLPDPATFVFFGYVGPAGEQMPSRLTAALNQTTVTPSGAPPDDRLSIQLSVDGGADPTNIRAGQFKIRAEQQGGFQTSYPAGAAYTETAAQLWTGDRATAPNGTFLEAAVRPNAGGTLTLTAASPLSVTLETPHAINKPTTPTVAPVTGAGMEPGVRRYAITYLLANGNESPPSDATAQVTTTGTDARVRLTNIPTGPAAPAGDPNLAVAERHVYRTRAGDAGEFFFVAALPGNVPIPQWNDTTADTALGPVPPGRFFTRYVAPIDLDIDAILTTKEAGVVDRKEVYFTRLPRDFQIRYAARPAAGAPRLTYQADRALGTARVVLPTLGVGDYRRGEARIRELPGALGADWLFQTSKILRLEIGGPTPGTATGPIGEVALVLLHAERPWRDAPQTVCVELVEKWRDAANLEKARLRAAVRSLRRMRVALGERGPRHSLPGDGIQVALELGQDRVRGREGPQDRSLRFLRVADTYGPRERAHLLVRVGQLPDSMSLDLRATTGATPDDRYLGVLVQGAAKRLKLLSLNEPSAAAPQWNADDLRVWLAAPETPERVDFTSTKLDNVLEAAASVFAELSLRNPNGIGAGAGAPKHVKAAARVPRTLRLEPETISYGLAGAGSTGTRTNATSLTAAIAADWRDKTLRYLTGPLAGSRRRITSVDVAGASLDTADFGATPGTGNRFAIEGEDGMTVETDPAGAAGPGASGRVAFSTQTDTLLATRATPQVKVRNAAASAGGEPAFHSATARLLGLDELNLTTRTGFLRVRGLLDPGRINTAFRVHLRELDTRFAAADRDLLKVRIAAVPSDLTFLSDTPNTFMDLALSGLSGPGALWMEPGKMRADGPRTGTPAGIGLVQFQFDALPRRASVTFLPSALRPGDETPQNWTAVPTGWLRSGLRVDVSDAATLRFLRLIEWDRDNPSNLSRIFWSRTDMTFLTLAPTAPTAPPGTPALVPMWLLTPTERPAADPEKPKSGISFRVPTSNRLTLDLDSYGAVTSTVFQRWNGFGGTWRLKAELQASGFAGVVTVAEPLGSSPAETIDAGRWFLRVVDARDQFPSWIFVGFGSAYFGNTGGWVGSRPRLFA